MPVDPTSDAFYEAGMGALRGHVHAFGLMLKRQEGIHAAARRGSTNAWRRFIEGVAA